MPAHMTEQVAVALSPVPAGNRDVELGIAPHSVLGYVQSRRLDVLLDANPPQVLQRPEAAERGGEREYADRQQAERLNAELMERAGVHQAARAGREVRRERRHREQPRRERSPDA